jgi:hypothetical protein
VVVESDQGMRVGPTNARLVSKPLVVLISGKSRMRR